MAIDIPKAFDVNPFDCHWDPVDPHSCFDETSCGCYVSPCAYFGHTEPDCEVDTSDLCCTEVKFC